ncbi:MAG: hypothetical protein KGY61_12435 [Desulfobacterales bacterium]|nr:hypothetical protein [Desulfobacterales bacterium]
MTGIEAILHHNGFGMAAVGVTIVFTALVTLSLIISQLHKLLLVWEERETYINKARRMFSLLGPKEVRRAKNGEKQAKAKYIASIKESSRQFNILIQAMGEPFSLPELIRIAESLGIESPYAAVAHLIEGDLIIPDQKGFYLWNHEAYNSLSKRS